MFDALERRGIGLCIGIVFGILFIGRLFGTSIWALFLLGFCIASGVWLWVEEVVRSGRDMEWSNEQLRGQTVYPRKCPALLQSLLTISSRPLPTYCLSPLNG